MKKLVVATMLSFMAASSFASSMEITFKKGRIAGQSAKEFLTSKATEIIKEGEKNGIELSMWSFENLKCNGNVCSILGDMFNPNSSASWSVILTKPDSMNSCDYETTKVIFVFVDGEC